MNQLDSDNSPPSVITAEANLIASGKETAATVSHRHSPSVWQLIIDEANRMIIENANRMRSARGR